MSITRKIIKYREKRYLQKLRKRNKNANPTIVSNNCVGGIIYHNLGLKFLSPTINLYLMPDEYLEFVKNFQYYSQCDICESKDEDKGFPVGVIIPKDDEHKRIKVYFQHYHSFDEAKTKWIERYKRVNWNNIFFIWEFYHTKTDFSLIEEFDSLDIKNKIVITHRKFDNIKNSKNVTCYENDLPVAKILEYNGLSGKRYLEEVDYVEFLNNKY